jgi:photosynthetic reaction center cytochrome c subunit
MEFSLWRVILVGAIVAAISILFTTSWKNIPGSPSAGTVLARAQAPAAARPQMSEQAFKNIQVLKGIPVDEFMGTMGLFSAALSVCCGDCHVGAGTSNPQWEADPPRKQMARKMVAMVNAINRDNFGGRQVVTCWTCHRGSPAPSITPPIDMIYGEALSFPRDVVIPAPAGNAPTIDQIFDKYIQALGGAQRLAALTSYTVKGNSNLFGEVRQDPFEIYAKAPNLLSTIVHQREGDLARVYNGRQAWVMLPLTVVGEYPLNGSALEGGKLDAQLAFPAGIRGSIGTWRVGVGAVVDGHDTNVAQGFGNNGFIVTLFFDKESGLLRRMIRYANSAVGHVPTQIDYDDYRPVAGVMMPYKWTYSWVSGREEYTAAEYQPNATIDAAKFNEPVQRKQ